MQAYSVDLRQRVVAGYEKGFETILEVAERFQLSDSFIQKLLRRKRQPAKASVAQEKNEKERARAAQMGDNRDNSSDSRYWRTLDKELIKGKYYMTYAKFKE